MRCYQCRGGGRILSQCPDCLGFFCHMHVRPEAHAFTRGKPETCATRTVRLMRVFESVSVAVPAGPGS